MKHLASSTSLFIKTLKRVIEDTKNEHLKEQMQTSPSDLYPIYILEEENKNVNDSNDLNIVDSFEKQ